MQRRKHLDLVKVREDRCSRTGILLTFSFSILIEFFSLSVFCKYLAVVSVSCTDPGDEEMNTFSVV